MNDIVEAMRYCASVRDGSKCAECQYSTRTGGECVEGLLAEAADEVEFLNEVIEVERKEHKEALEAECKKHETSGRWIKDNNLYKCTACNGLCAVVGWAHCIPEEQMYKAFKYCPNCGAKMEPPKGEENE